MGYQDGIGCIAASWNFTLMSMTLLNVGAVMMGCHDFLGHLDVGAKAVDDVCHPIGCAPERRGCRDIRTYL